MRRIFKIGVVLISLLCIRSTYASSDSIPINFTLPPGMYQTLPITQLYQEYYNISCNVKDANNSRTGGFNAIKIDSLYRPHVMSFDGSDDAWHSRIVAKTKMSGTSFMIKGVRKYDDKIMITNLDYTDMLAFACVADIVEK